MNRVSFCLLILAVALLAAPVSASTCPAGWVDITAKVNNPTFPLVCEWTKCTCADFAAKKCTVVFPPASSIICDKGSIPEQPGGGCTTGCVAFTPPGGGSTIACPAGWVNVTAKCPGIGPIVCAPPPTSANGPDLVINAAWGGTNVGSTIYGPKLTAFISVKNKGTADCVPPAGQQFVVGVYFKSIGLIKATSVGPFPTHIAPGQTVNFVAQGTNQIMLTEQYQKEVYNGWVDFYVTARAPNGPEYSAAIVGGCAAPEASIANNNAHSVKKTITNP